MAYRHKFYFVILGIIVSLLFSGDVRAEEGPPSDHAMTQETIAGPEPHAIKLVSFDPWVIEGEVKGAVATYVYDDVATESPLSIAASSKRKTSSREFLLSSWTATHCDEIFFIDHAFGGTMEYVTMN